MSEPVKCGQGCGCQDEDAITTELGDLEDIE